MNVVDLLISYPMIPILLFKLGANHLFVNSQPFRSIFIKIAIFGRVAKLRATPKKIPISTPGGG